MESNFFLSRRYLCIVLSEICKIFDQSDKSNGNSLASSSNVSKSTPFLEVSISLNTLRLSKVVNEIRPALMFFYFKYTTIFRNYMSVVVFFNMVANVRRYVLLRLSERNVV